MESVTSYEEDLNHSGWHASEKRVEKVLFPYFRGKGYKIASHCLQDRFDLVAARIKDGPRIEALIGIEVKSKADTLKRLDLQIPEYIQFFDFVYVALEAHELPESFPSFVGIIRISNDDIVVEREAHQIGRNLFPWCLTDAALARTIKASKGVQRRNKELKAYLSVLDDLRRKILYNCIFWDDPLPLNGQEKRIVDFIEKGSTSISKLELFMHECGRTGIVGG
ncbi:MAG: hypothetical protein AYK18_15760 [Theionarchaea archaeon DG-70]|nr:MAG: hypothetical protein AYK18_15760 [Theionarchaea archaeon DG-70]